MQESEMPRFVPFVHVKLDDPFWAPRQAVNRKETIPWVLDACRRTGRLDALRLGWRPGDPNPPHLFWESDVAKWLEGACHAYAAHPSASLRRSIDEVAGLFEGAQQPDGYLNVHFTVVEPGQRFKRLWESHELYNAGHLIEAGVAHRRATGGTRFLDVVRRYADLLVRTFGPGPGQSRGYPGHPEIELALVALAGETGDLRYRELARFFIDERGAAPSHFAEEIRAAREAGRSTADSEFDPAYFQADAPVRAQADVHGHAVRALYLYSGMADLARETGDTGRALRCRRLWRSLERRLYVTGGAGARRRGEAFGDDYELPNETAYAETCAGVALAGFARRMFQLDPRAEYIDVMERALYNNVAAGVSLDGKRFFYANPLAAPETPEDGASENVATDRSGWFDCACCPTSIARTLPQLGGLAYAANADTVWSLLFLAGDARVAVRGVPVELHLRTRYPWDERIEYTVRPARPVRFTFALRAPGWLRHGAATLAVNGRRSAFKLKRGFVHVTRDWRAGDRVEWRLPMPVERVYARPEIRENAGRVALMRGPIVFCFEQRHNGVNLSALSLPRDAPVTAEYSRKRLGGGVALRARGRRLVAAHPEAPAYDTAPPKRRIARLTAVPYAVWNNSGPGGMMVWIREE